MDLVAYCQIEDLKSIAEKNGICIPRLRGYRLMSEESLISEDERNKWVDNVFTTHCKYVIFDYYNRRKYMTDEELDWSRVHGRLRKKLKFELKKIKRRVTKQVDTFNKYVGRNDILMVHARIGGNNWNYYGGPELETKSWFIEKVDDCFDNTYCDIYVTISGGANDIS